MQQEGEPFQVFYTSLRDLSSSCEYGALRNEMIRDRVVIGITNNAVREKLFATKNLSLDKAVEINKAVETSKMQAKEVTQTGGSEEQVNAVGAARGKRNQKRPSVKDRNNTQFWCKRCDTTHGPKSCPAYGKTCGKCRKQNHFT